VIERGAGVLLLRLVAGKTVTRDSKNGRVIYLCRCVPTWLSSCSRSHFDEAPSLRPGTYDFMVVEAMLCKDENKDTCTRRSRRGADQGTGVSMQGSIMLGVNIAWGAARILRVGSES
jgi:hypothetical protein